MPDLTIKSSHAPSPARARLATSAAAVMLLAGGGCGGDTPESPDGDVRLDRALAEVVVLGLDVRGTTFRDVRGVGVDSLGNTWVAEWDALIHLFDARGEHLRTWERRGGGPGEFTNILALDLDPLTTRILVRSPQRISILNEDLELVTGWPLAGGFLSTAPGIRFGPGASSVLFPLPTRVDSVIADNGMRDAWTLAVLLRYTAPEAPPDTIAEIVGARRLAYSRADGIGWFTSMPGAGRAIWTPIGENMLFGDGHGAYRLSLVAPSGDTLVTFQRELESRRYTVPANAFSGGAAAGAEFPLGFVHSVLFDDSREELLVCRVEDPELESPRPLEAPRGVRVDYFTLAAEYLGTLRWPACPLRVSPEGVLYATVRGDFGEPLVKGFRYTVSP